MKRLVLVLVAVLVFVFGFAGITGAPNGVEIVKSVARPGGDGYGCFMLLWLFGYWDSSTCMIPDGPNGFGNYTGWCQYFDNFPGICSDGDFWFTGFTGCCEWIKMSELNYDSPVLSGPYVEVQRSDVTIVNTRYIVQEGSGGLEKDDILVPECGSPKFNAFSGKRAELQVGHLSPWKIVRKDWVMDVKIDDGLLKTASLQFAGMLGKDLTPGQIARGYKERDIVLLESTATPYIGTLYVGGKMVLDQQGWAFKQVGTGQVSVDKYGARIWH